MAVGTVGLRRTLVTAYPGLADIVHTMGTTVDAAGHGCMADRALADRCSVPLGLDGG